MDLVELQHSAINHNLKTDKYFSAESMFLKLWCDEFVVIRLEEDGNRDIKQI